MATKKVTSEADLNAADAAMTALEALGKAVKS